MHGMIELIFHLCSQDSQSVSLYISLDVRMTLHMIPLDLHTTCLGVTDDLVKLKEVIFVLDILTCGCFPTFPLPSLHPIHHSVHD